MDSASAIVDVSDQRYYHSSRSLKTGSTNAFRPRSDLSYTSDSTKRKNLVLAKDEDVYIADDRGVWSLTNDRPPLVYPLDETVVQLAGQKDAIFVLTPSSLRSVDQLDSEEPGGSKKIPLAHSAVAMAATNDSCCLIADDFGVTLVDVDRPQSSTRKAVSEVVENICMSEMHPRVCYLAAAGLLRVDFRERAAAAVKVVNACKPSLQYAGLLSCLDGMIDSNVASGNSIPLQSSSNAVWHWSAVAANPETPHLLALVSQRYEALGIFDLRNHTSPVAEYCLSKRSAKSPSCQHVKWSQCGKALMTIDADEILYTDIELGRGVFEASFMKGVKSKQILGADWMYSGVGLRMAVVDSTGALCVMEVE